MARRGRNGSLPWSSGPTPGGVYLLAVGIPMVFPGLALWLPALMN
jgi:hypothetical protein